MVRVKSRPRHATVRPPKCIVYMTRNPITFSIHRHQELFHKDEEARMKKQKLDTYKKHVHAPLAENSSTATPQETSHR